MIAAQTTKVLANTIEGRSVDFSLDTDSLTKLMKMMTDLYNDRIMACIRETCTNALDSHVEAGSSAPIEVSLPTPLDLYFRVQDRGTGLSADEFIEVYSKYGKSTRATSNDYAGMMGLGCKAPLTYASQYTVYSVKDGIAYEVLITRNEIGTGKITVVSETPTDEPNGVLVEIMANEEDVNGWRDRATKFFGFWDPNLVRVNGMAPIPIEGTKVGDNMLIINEPNIQRNYVVMGNVPYPVATHGNWSIQHGMKNGYTLVAYVPLGAVSIPPAREGLSEDKHTQDALSEIEAEFEDKVVGSIQRDINTCRSPFEAVQTLVKWQQLMPEGKSPSFKDYTFQGRTIPSKIDLPVGSLLIPREIPTKRGDGGKKASSKVESIGASSFNKRLIFTGWNYSGWTATMRSKLDQWIVENELEGDFAYIMIRPDAFVDPWFDDCMVFPWADVKAIKLAPREGGGGRKSDRIPGSFDVVTEDGSEVGFPADDIDQEEPVYYYQGNLDDTETYSHIVTKIHRTATLVAVPANRLNKFLRDFPKARNVQEVAREAYLLWKTTLSTDDLRAMKFQRDHAQEINRSATLPVDRINDPRFAEHRALATYDVSDALRSLDMFGRMTATFSLLNNDVLKQRMLKNPMYDYPLVGDSKWSTIAHGDIDHYVMYINAVYAARLDGATL